MAPSVIEIGSSSGARIIAGVMLTQGQVPTSGAAAGRSVKPVIGLNALLLSQDTGYRNAGLSRYIRQLLRHLPTAAPDMDLLAYLSDPSPSLSDWTTRIAAWNTGHAAGRILWEQLVQPWALRRDGVDLVHALVNVGPVVHHCPVVVTIHDLTFIRFPELFPSERRGYLQKMTRWTARRAARIIVDSASTGQDVEQLLGVPAERIAVVYPGLTEGIARPTSDAIAALRARYDLPDEFVLFVGTLEPRKNIALLLDVWALLASRRDVCPTLVIAGGKGWFYETLETRVRALGLTNIVRFVGYVADDDLPAWYAASTLFVFPSLYEGFGFTPLEAMACGTPVIVSSTSSLPEVVGDAGLGLPPDDPEAWAEAVASLLSSPTMRCTMAQGGVAQAACFSWSTTAHQTAEVYRQVLSNV